MENEHETRLYEEKTPSFFLTDFPEFTSTLEHERNDDKTQETANKIDVILSGQKLLEVQKRS